MGGVPDCLHFKEHLNQNSNPETYITSEHSYQKPGTGLEHARDEQGIHTAAQFNLKEEEVTIEQLKNQIWFKAGEKIQSLKSMLCLCFV